MRQFKFRVWDDGDMLEVASMSWSGGRLIVTGWSEKRHTFILISKVNPSIEQSTGLLDKNGKEIFKGDVIKAHYNDIPGRVDFGEYPIDWSYGEYNDSYMVGWVINYIGLKSDDRQRDPLDSEFAKELEIIGNIHENPELVQP
jgi:uncharacterized phage protein (TIGR01671 family)